METLINLAYQASESIALLALPALGLIVIFGMMGVINMAHGEMMMVGAYVTSFAYYAGVPSGIGIVLGGIAAALVGILLERLIVRRFYGQLLSSLVVTWGISLIMSQGALLLFGPLIQSVPTPFGSFSYGDYSYSIYRLVMIAASLLLVLGVWALFRFTEFGVRARSTMEKPEMARALGVDTGRMYALTFGLGAGLAGIAGGLFALTSTIGPFYGANYTPQAFITVVVGGGTEVISGLLASAFTLGLVRTAFTNQYNILIGYFAMLVFALIVIRFLPTGISDWLEKRRVTGMRR